MWWRKLCDKGPCCWRLPRSLRQRIRYPGTKEEEEKEARSRRNRRGAKAVPALVVVLGTPSR